MMTLYWQRYKPLLMLLLVLLLIYVTILFALFFRAKIAHPFSRHVLFGAWTQGFFNPITQTLHPGKLVQFENLIDKKVSIAHYYLGWEWLTSPKLLQQFNTLHAHGWQPMLNVNPYYFSQCPASSLPLYRAIARGKCDLFLTQAGKNLAKIQQPFFFVFAWEMNNEQNSWSITTTGSTPQDFIAAWRHMYAIFKKENVTHIIWVFCPNVPDNPTMPYTTFYPGNAYVDWVGLDGYNWGTTQSWSNWESFSQIFSGSYTDITHLAPNKPLLIAEVNTTDKGGNKASWYTDMLTQQIPNNFPRIDALVIFNEDRTQQEQVNWQVNTTQSSLKAFLQGIHLPTYQ